MAAAYLSIMLRSVWAGGGIHGGLHVGGFVAHALGVEVENGPVVWVAEGLVFAAVAVVLAHRIGPERWAEIAERGPYALPPGRAAV